MANPKCVNCAAELPHIMCLKNGECFNADADSEGPTGILDLVNEDREEKHYKDPISTGRKRAAVAHPITAGQVCEWAWRKQCGGGISPIFGCTGRPATDIHHGPDKSTFANDSSNISRICTFCHNRWHAANDKFYIEPRPADNSTWLPTINLPVGAVVKEKDAMIKASKMEILAFEMSIPEGGKDRG